MDANTYQKEVQRTLIDVPDREIPYFDLRLVYDLVSIAVEIGKLVEHVKKGIFHQHGIDEVMIGEKLEAIAEMVTGSSPDIPNLNGQEVMKLWVLSGLIGETAEIGEGILTELETGEESNGLQEEVGDLSWYAASILTQHKKAFNDSLMGNITKLQKRYRNGYSSEASRNREENSTLNS